MFSPQEKSYVRGTCDFLGISHFTTRYITQKNFPSNRANSYFTDRDLAELVDPQWPDPGSEWLYSVPWGFRRLLSFVKVHWHISVNNYATTTCSLWPVVWLEMAHWPFMTQISLFLDTVWRPCYIRDRKWCIREDDVHRTVWWLENAVLAGLHQWNVQRSESI